jgi:hypothetical protein
MATDEIEIVLGHGFEEFIDVVEEFAHGNGYVCALP